MSGDFLQYIMEIVNEFDNSYPNTYSGDKLNYIQTIAKQSNLYSSVVKDAYKKGKKGLIGVFIGEVKKISQGKADPQKTTQLLETILSK